MNTPGTSPAANRTPIDWFATEPAMIIRIDGGMIVARAEVVRVNAAE